MYGDASTTSFKPVQHLHIGGIEASGSIRAFLAHVMLFSGCNGIDKLVRTQSGKSHA